MLGDQKPSIKKKKNKSSHCASAVTHLTSIPEDEGSIPDLAQWVKEASVAVSFGVGRRFGSDLVLQWLWCRPAAAAAIHPLAWKPLYASATGGAQNRKKKKKKSHKISVKRSKAKLSRRSAVQ